jgi:EAL domain-containing protein (putative c-di-GMP-specific phosphodiesterase class I)/CheY-like chemotaxis protein
MQQIMMNETPRLLIVDDDGEIRSILHEHLGRAYNCVATDSAERALGLLRTQGFDLVLTDIAMAGMSGLEMLPHISTLAPDSVMVMISGQRTIDSAIDAMRAGAFDYITKPFDLTEVSAIVRRALDNRRRIDRARFDADSTRRARELAAAIEREEFIVHYQRQVDIQTRRVVGAEALVRWQHPQLGLLLPKAFIETAEKNGSIIQIGATVLRAACKQARCWRDTGIDGLRVAVNASPRQLREDDFPETLRAIVDETGITADLLEIEVTENSFIENGEPAIRTLCRLREMGARIAVDDFGTGYSSLGYLKRLPIDSVKLDASFVKDATTDPDDAALVMAIITLAHNLGKEVIAEGVEREDQFAFLRLLRCDKGQGLLFGGPVAAESFDLPLATPMFDSVA